MGVMGRSSFEERFRSPAALAAFGAFAVPEPFGVIMLFCAAIWWWRRRRRKVLSLAIEGSSARPNFDVPILTEGSGAEKCVGET
jgi:hypothetical protein